VATMPRPRESEQRYEELRREILEGSRGRGPGLAIFLRRGMASWLQELTRWTEAMPLRRGDVEQPGALLPSDTGSEIVRVLAGMILGRECVQRA